MLIPGKCHFHKTRGHFFISALIFTFKVSMDSSHQARLNGVMFLKINWAVLEILMKNILYETRFHQYLRNGSINFQKDNTTETALMRRIYRDLKLENWCRNKEMVSCFAKMKFYGNENKIQGVQKNQKCCFSQETYSPTCFITQ